MQYMCQMFMHEPRAEKGTQWSNNFFLKLSILFYSISNGWNENIITEEQLSFFYIVLKKMQ